MARTAREIGKRLRADLYMDPDKLAKHLGWRLYRTRKEFVDPVNGTLTTGAIRNGRIYLQDGLARVDELLVILHEYCHHRYHADCVGYADLDLFHYMKDETQANVYSTIGLYPSLNDYETEDQFRAESIMPESFTELRIAFERKQRRRFR